jgi:hypothetical protein|nr:hypothetical protein [uncultured Campylobacter sp.]
MRFLFLDFDGVLFDTASEAYEVCRSTPSFSSQKFGKNQYTEFFKFRPLVGPAWNYYFVMRAIADNDKELLAFDYNDEAKKFEKDFFQTREKLKVNNYEGWLALNRPYPFLSELSSMKLNWQIFIVTTKDSKTVLDLAKRFNIQFIDNDNILGADIFAKFNSKANIINSILKDDDRGIFIDDSEIHLKKCEHIKGLKLLQPDWGYVKNDSKYICDIKTILSVLEEEV